MPYYHALSSPIGTLYAVADNEKLISLGKNAPMQGMNIKRTALMIKLEAELNEYFAGERKSFDIPFEESGTPWQRKCYAALRNIPYGEVRTYKQLASAAGNGRAARAAGGACHSNPLLIITPCHRVIGASGALTGFAAGIEAKQKLLEIEKKT